MCFGLHWRSVASKLAILGFFGGEESGRFPAGCDCRGALSVSLPNKIFLLFYTWFCFLWVRCCCWRSLRIQWMQCRPHVSSVGHASAWFPPFLWNLLNDECVSSWPTHAHTLQRSIRSLPLLPFGCVCNFASDHASLMKWSWNNRDTRSSGN